MYKCYTGRNVSRSWEGGQTLLLWCLENGNAKLTRLIPLSLQITAPESVCRDGFKKKYFCEEAWSRHSWKHIWIISSTHSLVYPPTYWTQRGAPRSHWLMGRTMIDSMFRKRCRHAFEPLWLKVHVSWTLQTCVWASLIKSGILVTGVEDGMGRLLFSSVTYAWQCFRWLVPPLSLSLSYSLSVYRLSRAVMNSSASMRRFLTRALVRCRLQHKRRGCFPQALPVGILFWQ